MLVFNYSTSDGACGFAYDSVVQMPGSLQDTCPRVADAQVARRPNRVHTAESDALISAVG